ncbi:hypothetical protein G5I_13081 [Acromyrmex echinatior]|uniref:Uncharacterized protein n=1 Tax=Acromyrmex echinatior TaxID=103372 RepID=F4X431_ACREC|nr:hypothetical protein G5I_13081 [Acromyrmex echinatior]
MIRQAIYYDETLTVLDVQVAHRRELLGAGGVKDLEDTWRVVHLDFFTVEILDRWIVLLHKATGYELDDGSRETRIDLRRLVVRLPGYYGDYAATPGHDTGRLSVCTFYTQAHIRRHSSHPCLPACLLAPACRLPPLPAHTPSSSNPAAPTAQPRSDVRDAAILLSPSGFSSNERHVVAQIIDCSRTLDVVSLENTLRIHGKPRQRYPRPCRGAAEEETVVGFHKCLKNHNTAMPLSVATMSSLMANWRNLRTVKNSLNNCSCSNNFTEVISDIGNPICEPQMRACDTL